MSARNKLAGHTDQPLTLIGKVTDGALITLMLLLQRPEPIEITLEDLALERGLAARTVATHLTELKNVGIITVKRQGLGRPNLVTVLR